MADKDDMLPLHHAAKGQVGERGKAVVTHLLAAAPQAASMMAKDGTPLHIAARHNARQCADFLPELFQAAPKAASLAIEGELPLQLAAQNVWASPKTIQILVSTAPEAAQRRDKFGQLPLHRVSAAGMGPEVVRCILRAAPTTVLALDMDGAAPLHVYGKELNKEEVEDVFDACQESVATLLVCAPQALLTPDPILWPRGGRVLRRHDEVVFTHMEAVLRHLTQPVSVSTLF